MLIEDNQLIKLYDAAYHQTAAEDENDLVKTAEYDRRWIKVRVPTVIVGGELTNGFPGNPLRPTSKTSEGADRAKKLAAACSSTTSAVKGSSRLDCSNRWTVGAAGESRLTSSTPATCKEVSRSPFEQLDHLLHEPGAF